MRLFDGGIIIFLIVGAVATLLGGHTLDSKKREQEYKFYSTCLDNATFTEDKELCTVLFGTNR